MSWNRRSKSLPSAECDSDTELIRWYLLDDIDESETVLLKSHLESCSFCSLLLGGDGETVARFAFAVPQQKAPLRVKDRLVGRIESEERFGLSLARIRDSWSSYLEDALGSLSAHSSKMALAGVIVAIILGGVWFNDRLHGASPKQLPLALDAETLVTDGLDEPHHDALPISLSPGASVNMLSGTGPGQSARGVLVASRTSNRALLLVVDLSPLPYGMVYQVWLIKNDLMHDAGWFTVDSTGYGQTVIIPVAPFWEFDAVGITIEPREGGIDPTGVSVLSGEL